MTRKSKPKNKLSQDDVMIVVDEDGKILTIHSDTLNFLKEGDGKIKRASHVEPQGTKWIADLSPVEGPQLGPFLTRAKAIQAELRWLNQHLEEIKLK